VVLTAAAYPETTNVARILSDEDANPDNNEDSDTTNVLGQVDLSVSITDDERMLRPGADTVYRVTAENAGPTEVEEVTIELGLPEAVVIDAISTEQGTFDRDTGVWSEILLMTGDSLELTVEGSLAPEFIGLLTSEVTILTPSNALDPDDSNNWASDETNVTEEDCDTDGISDEEEERLGLDPCSNDTDRDGLPDDVELDGDTDPDNPDSDWDGLCDGPEAVDDLCDPGEDLNGNGVVDPGESSPTNGDTDGDGLDDWMETHSQNATDPSMADTDGDGLCDGAIHVADVCLGGE